MFGQRLRDDEFRRRWFGIHDPGELAELLRGVPLDTPVFSVADLLRYVTGIPLNLEPIILDSFDEGQLIRRSHTDVRLPDDWPHGSDTVRHFRVPLGPGLGSDLRPRRVQQPTEGTAMIALLVTTPEGVRGGALLIDLAMGQFVEVPLPPEQPGQ